MRWTDTTRRALAAATVSVIAAGVSVVAATYHPSAGPIQIQQAEVITTPSTEPLPGSPNPTITPSVSPPVDTDPLPGSPVATVPTPPVQQPPASSAPVAPAKASPSPEPKPRAQYCGQPETLAPSTVQLASSTTTYRCPQGSSSPVASTPIGPGSFSATGYVQLAEGRFYVLANGALIRA